MHGHGTEGFVFHLLAEYEVGEHGTCTSNRILLMNESVVWQKSLMLKLRYLWEIQQGQGLCVVTVILEGKLEETTAQAAGEKVHDASCKR